MADEKGDDENLENGDLREQIVRELTDEGDPAPSLTVEGRRVTVPPRDLTGIALSGGGIRSATFNLGLLQGLRRLDVLDRLDYLSTVSGGGYIGSCWSAWRFRAHETDRDEERETQRPSTPFQETGRAGVGRDAAASDDPVQHLREFSNFLAPRLGLLSWDSGRMVVTVLSSILPSLLAALSLLALAILVWTLLAWGLLATDPLVSTILFGVLTAVAMSAMERSWRRLGEELSLGKYVRALLVCLALTVGLWLALLHHPSAPFALDGAPPFATGADEPFGGAVGLPVPLVDAGVSGWTLLLTPVVVWVILSLLFSLGRFLGSRRIRTHQDRLDRSAFDRLHARLLLLAGVWIGAVLLWWVSILLWEWARLGFEAEITAGLVGSTGLTVWLFSQLQKRMSGEFTAAVGRTLLQRLRPVLPALLAYLAIALLLVCLMVALLALEAATPTASGQLILGGAATLALLLILVFFDPNEVGLHTFYRARISRAYLGASNPDPRARGRTEEQRDDDVELSAVPRSGPCHLICCAANDLSSRELGGLHRGARSAVLAPAGFSVDGRAREWEGDSPTLSAAATASAAAFNPLMGDRSRGLGPAVTFLMAAFNLRLGLWLPGVAPDEGADSRTPSRSARSNPMGLSGWPFFLELFGHARADGPQVHLSDGGHFENMAVYELIRRHCRFIVASDCGMDPDVEFNDLGNLVRRVRADFGVDIQIDLSPLRPDESGRSRQAMVAGDIHYPEGDTGILLLIKPTVTGDEPADVAQYRARNPVFPHESTGDQFYDEAQWEAYRRLGEHVARAAFSSGARELQGRPPVPGLFLQARREWQPVPEGFAERLSLFSDRIGEIDKLLRDPECTNLRRQVFREIGDLDPGSSKRDSDAEREAEAAAMDPADLGPALHLVRRVLLLMQEVYTREELELRANHPLYLGLMNYFARWTSAPLFRLWWPVLRTMHPRPFTRFVERHFGVGGPEEDWISTAKVGAPLSSEEALAFRGWSGADILLEEARRVIPYYLSLTYLDRGYPIQVAQLTAIPVNGDLAWRTEDFFVPAGLWGAGIGGSFLRALTTPDAAGSATSPEAGAPGRPDVVNDPRGDPMGGYFVLIEGREGDGATEKKDLANEVQLYRSAAFREVEEDAVPTRVVQALAASEAMNPPSNGDASEEGAVASSREASQGSRIWMAWLPSGRTPETQDDEGPEPTP